MFIEEYDFRYAL